MNFSFNNYSLETSRNQSYINADTGIAVHYITVICTGLSAVLNIGLFTALVCTKKLRSKLLFQLITINNLIYIVTAFLIGTYHSLILYNSDMEAILCLPAGRIFGLAVRTSSCLHTGFISIDGYQASLPLPKPILEHRRFNMRIASASILCIIFILFSVLGFVVSETLSCDVNFTMNLVSSTSLLASIWLFIWIFLISLPFCIQTYINIQKTISKDEIRLSAAPSTNVAGPKQKKEKTQTLSMSVHGNSYVKMRVLRILIFLISIQILTFLPQLLVFILFSLNVSFRENLFDIIILLTIINHLLDPLICIITIKHFRQSFLNALFFVCRLTKCSTKKKSSKTKIPGQTTFSFQMQTCAVHETYLDSKASYQQNCNSDRDMSRRQ